MRRSDKQPKERLTGSQGKLAPATQVKYDDGVKVRVKIGPRRSQQASGPGAFPGRSVTKAKISLTNDSGRTLDATQVVVTTTYGKPARIASPVYEDASTADFGGVVEPGDTATAQYAFAIADRGVPVAITVDWDESHAPAVFTGKSS